MVRMLDGVSGIIFSELDPARTALSLITRRLCDRILVDAVDLQQDCQSHWPADTSPVAGSCPSP